MDDNGALFDKEKGGVRGTKAVVVAACHAASAKSAVGENFIVLSCYVASDEKCFSIL